MKTGAIIVAMTACLSAAKPALSATPAKTLDHNYTLAVDVDPLGQITQAQPAADTPAPIAAVLDQAVKQWRFVPAQRDGKAVPVHSYLVAEVQALPQGPGKFAVRVSYVGAGSKYEKPTTANGPDYPQQVMQALQESGPSRSGAVVVIHLTLPPGGQLAATDAHVTTRAELSMREKLTLIAAAKRYVLQGSVRPELVDGKAVTANLQESIVISLLRVERSAAGPQPDQAAAVQAATSAAVRQDATQSQSVLKPSMVEAVLLQP
jgi:hypothetical protein